MYRKFDNTYQNIARVNFVTLKVLEGLKECVRNMNFHVTNWCYLLLRIQSFQIETQERTLTLRGTSIAKNKKDVLNFCYIMSYLMVKKLFTFFYVCAPFRNSYQVFDLFQIEKLMMKKRIVCYILFIIDATILLEYKCIFCIISHLYVDLPSGCDSLKFLCYFDNLFELSILWIKFMTEFLET